MTAKTILPAAIGAALLFFALTAKAKNPSEADSNDFPDDENGDALTRSTLDLPGAPIGVRNNNPLNIRPSSAYTWQGQIGQSNNFCRFQSLAWGVRASIKNLNTYFVRDGLDTLTKIISRWAPPTDNNDTAGYIQFVANRTGFGKNDRLKFDKSTIRRIVIAMSAMEVGEKWAVDVPLFDAAWGLAYPGVGAIFTKIPTLFECTDGTFSNKNTRRACTRHGGLKNGEPIPNGGNCSNLILVNDVPIEKISTDTLLFQGREKHFSARSVENIIAAVDEGSFLWANLDPITLFQHSDGRLIVLSGHSRFEAFQRLAKARAIADGKPFDRIPAKILRGVSIEAAKRLALESNTLSTKETDIERAAYYRKKRQNGTAERDLVPQIKKNEGKNWVNILAFSFLNPDGRTWAMLKQFADGEDTSATLAKSLAKWIGGARKSWPFLTNEHENEIFEWLFIEKGYGTGAGQVANEREFAEKLQTIIAKNTYFGEFEANKPLNIQRAQLKSPAEMQLQTQIDELTRQIQDLLREQTSKIKDLTARKATQTQIVAIMQPIEATLRRLRLELARLTQKKAEISAYSQNEATLFGLPRRRQSPSFH